MKPFLLSLSLALIATTAHAGPGDAALGEDLFDQYCAACHDTGASNGQGPSLKGVVGRRIAAVPGFAYSTPLKAAGAKGERWSEAQLDKFLTEPSKLYPGTAMPQAIGKPESRAALIAFLKTK
ncbi:c-type cytochrome [Asticcacaulis sp. BYS171W]|uniref:C-type cytochrome n=1 Tax=Asticcacaulis aquaticus TaxID=2984212 RepID=A0ABT5HTE9_9CAUL|nr:c-type cytochrome [Asticcacaulis aquaticus]